MASNRKTRKKYNPLSKAIKFAKSFSQQYAIIWAGTLNADVYKISTCSRVMLTRKEAEAIRSIPHKWQVHVMCMMRDHTDRDYLQSKELRFNNEYYSEEISDLVNEHMHEFVKEVNSNHMVNVGWVATTSQTDLTSEQLEKMMTKLGAWDFLAKHETTDSTEVLKIENQ